MFSNKWCFVILVVILSNCYYDGEKVSIKSNTFRSQECVTKYHLAYEANGYDVAKHGKIAPLHSPGFAQNNLLAEHSNICQAITITNNNHGHNSNNVVVIGEGLKINFQLDGKDIEKSLYDPLAADINITQADQTAGIISIFDPDNCVTPQGHHVRILKDDFNSCTFYLQLTDSSYHLVKDNAINLILNYSNGDQIYQAKTTLHYQPELMAANTTGDIFSTNVLSNNFNNKKDYAITEPVYHIINDNLGNKYFFGKNNIYVYQDKIILYQLSSPIINEQVKEDSFGNIFVSDGHDLYLINTTLAKKNNMLKITNNIPPLSSIELFAIHKSQLYILVNKNKIYKSTIGEQYNWELVLDGDTDLLLNGKKLHTIYNDVVYDYDFDNNKISLERVNIDPEYTGTEIKQWFELIDQNSSKSVPYFVFAHGDHGVLFSKKYHFFESNNNIKDATKIAGAYILADKSLLCLFGNNITLDVNSFRHDNQVNNNLLCLSEQQETEDYVLGIDGEINTLSGSASLN
jgi:hypothetical protein